LTKLGGREVLVRRGTDCFAIELTGKSLQDSQKAWEIRFAMDRDPKAREDTDVVFSIAGESPLQGCVPLDSFFSSKRFVGAAKALGTAVYLRLEATRLSEPSYLRSAEARIDFDGYGLASTIAHLMTYERDRFDRLESALQDIIPGVKRIRVRRIERKIPRRGPDASPENEKVLADELVLDMHSGDALPAHAISEGTLIVLGLLTVLEDPDRPNLILIEDIDHASHPRGPKPSWWSSCAP